MLKTCSDCRNSFTAKGAWQHRCWDCWREHKNEEIRDAGYRAGYRDGLAAARQPSRASLDPNLIRDCVALTHPDRHPAERYELANRVTATLLSLIPQGRP